MSIDQSVACRRAPKLPDDLPQAGEWKASMFEGAPVYTFSGRGWLVNVMVEATIEEHHREQLAEDLQESEIEAEPDSYGIMVSVSLEPSRAPQDGVDIMMAVLQMLETTCDGFVLAN